MIAERQDNLPRSIRDDLSTRRYRQHSASISITSVDLYGHVNAHSKAKLQLSPWEKVFSIRFHEVLIVPSPVSLSG